MGSIAMVAAMKPKVLKNSLAVKCVAKEKLRKNLERF